LKFLNEVQFIQAYGGGNMKRLLLIIPLFFLYCASPDISSEGESVKSGKTVLVIPFTSNPEMDKEIAAEAESRFISALVKNGYRIIKRDKLNEILKEPEFASSGITSDSIKKIGERLRADSVLSGEIINLSEYQKNVKQYSAFIEGSQIFGGESSSYDDMKTFTFFRFQINVTLRGVSDNAEIITIKNPYEDLQIDGTIEGRQSLEAYMNMVLDKMADELIKILDTKKTPVK